MVARTDQAPRAVGPGAATGARRRTRLISRVAFAVDDNDAAVAGLRAAARARGEVGRYEDSYRLCCVRGPEGIVVMLAEQIS